MHRVTECRASKDYRLWLRFEDGLEGSVFLGDLLDVGDFSIWRDVDRFCRASVNREAATVVWDGGIQFDPDILYQDLLSSMAAREFNPPGEPRRLNGPDPIDGPGTFVSQPSTEVSHG